MSPLLILGASTRAAAFSAIRAGFDPICGDMFADADLRQHARQIIEVPHYPYRLLDAVDRLSPVPWVYSGALENSPAEVGRVSAKHTLWGNPATVLRRSRDPWACSLALQKRGLPSLELRTSDAPPPRDQTWLLKPRRSAAGRAISLWSPEARSPAESHYFQRFVQGVSIAGAFLAGGGWTRLLGISQQLIGLPGLYAPPFGYCGSVFPAPRGTPELLEQIRQIGSTLSAEFGLRGLFGIDFIFDGERAWMTEINPRYTASMELIEYWHREPLFEWHRRACESPLTNPVLGLNRRSPDEFCAKVILYADRRVRAPNLVSWIPQSISVDTLPKLADIPVAGTEISPGQPVFTCLGSGSNPQQLVDDLIRQAQAVWQLFGSLAE